jgi:hypothetical protein
MARAAATLGTTDRCPGILDRSGRAILPGSGSTSNPPNRAPRTGPVLSQPGQGSWQAPSVEGAIAEQDVALHEIWFRLSLPDRERFGHRFSGMVLKALGLRSFSSEGDET